MSQTIFVKSNIIHIISFNSSGKTLFLKWLIKNNQLYSTLQYNMSQKNVSTSQHKKKNISLNSKKKHWILDEPYTMLDVNNYAYLKQYFKEHLNKHGYIYYTYNLNKNKKNITIYFFYSYLWL